MTFSKIRCVYTGFTASRATAPARPSPPAPCTAPVGRLCQPDGVQQTEEVVFPRDQIPTPGRTDGQAPFVQLWRRLARQVVLVARDEHQKGARRVTMIYTPNKADRPLNSSGEAREMMTAQRKNCTLPKHPLNKPPILQQLTFVRVRCRKELDSFSLEGDRSWSARHFKAIASLVALDPSPAGRVIHTPNEHTQSAWLGLELDAALSTPALGTA